MIVPTFFTEVNKIIQTYGLISLEYDKNDDWLIKPQNHLKLNVQYNIKKGNVDIWIWKCFKSRENSNCWLKNISILATEKKDTIGVKRKMNRIINGF